MAVHWQGAAASAAAAAVERHVRGLDADNKTLGHYAVAVAISILLPWLVFLAVGLLLILELEEARTLVAGQLTGIAGICMLLVTVGTANGRGALTALGLWCLASAAFGAGMGAYLNHEYGRIYWRIRNAGDGLVNVDPSSSPDSSAAMLTFSSAFVDDDRTIGFVAGGRIYCVAPIARRGKPSDNVTFWAAGVGCCERRSNFACGATSGPALSYPTDGDKYFVQAIAQAASVYGLKSQGAHHVFFEGDPAAFLDSIWHEGLAAAVLTATLHLLTCVVVNSAIRKAGAGLMLRGGAKRLSSLLGAMEEERPFERDCWYSCRSAAEVEQEKVELGLWRDQSARMGQGLEPLVLGDVVIAQDCGFNSEVPALMSGVGPRRYLTAALTLGLTVFNLCYMVKTDIMLLSTSSSGTTHMYLTSEAILKPIIERSARVLGFDVDVQLNAHVAVGLSELACLFYLLVWVGLIAVQAALADTWSRRRWKCIHRIFFNFLEPFSGFSAMALLHFLNPTILMQHIVDLSKASHSAVRVGAWFLFTRGIFFIVGFDAFLVKFRQTSEAINEDVLRVRSFLQAAGFMLQLLGIVQVSSIVRNRVALAFFGGEDALAGPNEKARESVFYALLTRELYRNARSTTDFVVMMVSFSDSDFQGLMLNKKQGKSGGNGKAGSPGMAGSTGKAGSTGRSSSATKGLGEAGPDSSMEEFQQVSWAIKTTKEKL